MVVFYFNQTYGFYADEFSDRLTDNEAYMIVDPVDDIIEDYILSSTSEPYTNNVNYTVQIYYTSDLNKFSEYYYINYNESFQDTIDGLENDGFDIVTYLGEMSYPDGRIDINEQSQKVFSTLNYGNKTVSSIIINNKEVQSIITSDNIVLYEKSNVSIITPSSISLSASKNILSYYSNENATLTATVLDDSDNPCENVNVVFNVDGYNESTVQTNNNGVATYTYNSEGVGDVLITATCNNLADSVMIEDCQYYNDGSNITGLNIQSGVSCTTDGEWITITTSTNGEKYVHPPVCYTGSDNWEVSFKCKTSNYSNQAFGLQMENCGTNTYSGDNQYTSYSGNGFNNCMGTGNKTYNLLDTDKITFKRIGGYWRLYVNDNTEIFNTNYNWTNNRVPDFYTNRNRIQRLKELKYKLIRS